MKRTIWWRSLTFATGAMLAGSLVVATAGTASAARKPGDPTPLSEAKAASAKPVPVKPFQADVTATRALHGAQKVAWPTAGVTDVDFTPAKLQAKQTETAGNLPVRLTPSTSDFGVAAAQPAKVRVEVLDQKLAEAAGTPGTMVRLSRADGVNKAAPVTADLDYSAYRGAFGGDWASRLQVVSLPPCAATTPSRPECRTKKPLATRNDTTAGRASAPVAAEPSVSVFALAAAPAGPTGDYTRLRSRRPARGALACRADRSAGSIRSRCPMCRADWSRAWGCPTTPAPSTAASSRPTTSHRGSVTAGTWVRVPFRGSSSPVPTTASSRRRVTSAERETMPRCPSPGTPVS